MSLKKALGIKKKKTASMEDQVSSPWVPKSIHVRNDDADDDDKTPPDTILVLQRNDSFDTADVTNPNTPSSQASSTHHQVEVTLEDHKNETTCGLPITSPSNESLAGASSASGNLIFMDTDDDTNDGNNTLHSSDKDKMEYSDEKAIQAKLELELSRLDEKLKSQKAERRAIAQEQLDKVASEEEEEETDSESILSPKKLMGFFEKTLLVESQNIQAPPPRKKGKFVSLALLLLPILHFFYSNFFLIPYCHETALEQAKAFFGKPTPMEGITVVVSETTSTLGRTIENRFALLGATVESLEDEMDCSNLDSVAASVDSLLKKHGSIDYLVQTGNLCLGHSIESLTSLQSTAQGHDTLVGGNYLSAFLATQKILPSLEKSKYGTLVQFTSQTATIVNPSYIQPTLKSLGLIEGDKTVQLLTKLAYLPLQFVYNKKFESVQHKVISRDYPNIRTLEISNGWSGIGAMAADDFFHRIFQNKDDEEEDSFFSSEDEDLQEHLYELSRNAVWKWVAPALPPVTELILGSPPTQKVVARAEQKSASASVARYLPVNTASIVTTGALAVLAMKTKTFSWWTGSS